jgi:o-succinylbenzoate---CoA ligase
MEYNALTLNGIRYSKEELEKYVDGRLNSQALKEHEQSLFVFIKEWIAKGDILSVKTSGSTGTPKQIVVKKSQMLESAKITCDYFKLSAETNALHCLSTDFIAGKMMVVRAFVSGFNLITVKPDNNPLTTINQKIHFAAMIPFQVQKVLAKKNTKEIFESIDNVIIGGAPVSHSFEQVLALFPNNVYATFAMTETLSHIALRKLSGKVKSELFELLPGIKISVNKDGCLVIDAPRLNEEPIVTNDVVEIKDETHFKWLGRHDNVINSGGVKLYPEKMEEVLSGVVKDHRSFIASLEDKEFGEKVVLVLEGVTKDEIVKIKGDADNALGKYEKPREYLTVAKFIETPNGKIKRKETLMAALGIK